METPELEEWRTNSNWRAHIANYVELKRHNKSYSPEQYCKCQKINLEAFQLWLQYIEKEDLYVYYTSFATEYLDRAKRSLSIVRKYMDEQELRMPLMRDAIVAYAAPFKLSNDRLAIKQFTLQQIQHIVPDSLQTVHGKICDDRDQIVAHTDLKPRNPRVGFIGIAIKGKGYCWEDYRALMPDFAKLISHVRENLQRYNQKNFTPKADYFKDFLHPPKCTEENPGPPSCDN